MSEKSAEKIVISPPVPTMAFLCDGISHVSLVHPKKTCMNKL